MILKRTGRRDAVGKKNLLSVSRGSFFSPSCTRWPWDPSLEHQADATRGDLNLHLTECGKEVEQTAATSAMWGHGRRHNARRWGESEGSRALCHTDAVSVARAAHQTILLPPLICFELSALKKNNFPIWYKQNLPVFLGESVERELPPSSACHWVPSNQSWAVLWGQTASSPPGLPCGHAAACLHCSTVCHSEFFCTKQRNALWRYLGKWWEICPCPADIPSLGLVSLGSGLGCAKVSSLYSIKIGDPLHAVIVNINMSDFKAEHWAITGEKNPWDMVTFPRACLSFLEEILIRIHFFSSSCRARLFQNAPEKVNSCESGRWGNHWVQAESFPQTYLFLEERKRHPKRKWEVMSYRNHFFHWLAPTQGLSAVKTKFVINSFPKLTCK